VHTTPCSKPPPRKYVVPDLFSPRPPFFFVHKFFFIIAWKPKELFACETWDMSESNQTAWLIVLVWRCRTFPPLFCLVPAPSSCWFQLQLFLFPLPDHPFKLSTFVTVRVFSLSTPFQVLPSGPISPQLSFFVIRLFFRNFPWSSPYDCFSFLFFFLGDATKQGPPLIHSPHCLLFPFAWPCSEAHRESGPLCPGADWYSRQSLNFYAFISSTFFCSFWELFFANR